MSKLTIVRASYRPNADELYQASVTIPNDYPDALDQAEKTVTRIVDHMIDHAVAAYEQSPEDSRTEP